MGRPLRSDAARRWILGSVGLLGLLGLNAWLLPIDDATRSPFTSCM